MKNKRMSFFLTIILMAILIVPTYAAETSIYTECRLPWIEVAVPATGEIIINPYGIPVEMDGETVTDQIIGTPTFIENMSEAPLQIDVSANAIIRRSPMILSDSTTVGKDTIEKEVFLYLEMQPASGPDSVTWDKSFNPSKHLVISTGTTSKENMLTLAEAGKPGRYGAFRLSGDCVVEPFAPWNSRDYVNVWITFTFNALPYGTKIT